MVGSSLGPYRILEPLGSGGMGDVYLAEDTRLGRKVAIKVLPEEFAADPERLARFEQEAKAAAALNHPHIAVVHDVGFAEGATATEDLPTTEDAKTDPNLEARAPLPTSGVHYIVQEYLEGDTLRVPLERGALPIAKALVLGREIASALGAAHAAGIIHRDLKPENVFITGDGHAKVLDFGLAKLTEAVMPASRMSMSPTMLGTVAGQVMGTAGYMAPEQVEGLESIDQRADLFAFGCVLYEMTAGKRAFSGPTVLDTLHAIARTEPQPAHEIKPGLPAELERILAKCLAKDPSARYQHADDLVVDMKNLAAAVESGTAATSATPAPTLAPSRWGPTVPAALAAVFVVLAATIGILGTRALTGAPEAKLSIFDIELPGGVRFNPGAGRSAMAISPDGSTVVYTAVDENGTQSLFRRRMDTLASERIAGSESALTPEFSPNGEWLTFFAAGEVRKLPIGGGQALTLAPDAASAVPAWSDDGNIYFLREDRSALWRVNSAGGTPEVAHQLEGDDNFGLRLQTLPGGRGLLVEVGSTGTNSLFALDLATGDLHQVGISGGRPTYSSAGYVLYADAGTLWARPFDLASLQTTGEPMLLTQGVFTLPGGQARFSVSDNHKLIYGPQQGRVTIGESLIWIGVDGNEIDRSPPSGGRIVAARISPDRERVIATVSRPDTTTALYVYDLVQRTFAAFTEEGNPLISVWSPDGAYVYFSATDAEGSTNIYRQRADLSARREEILSAPGMQVVTAITPDGDLLVYSQSDDAPRAGSDIDLWVVPAEPGAEARPILETETSDSEADLSPDGEWFAYTTTRSGEREVWVRRLDGEGPGLKVSAGNGWRAGWTPDGSAVIYHDRLAFFRARLDFDPAPRIQPQEPLAINSPQVGSRGARSYDVYADGGETMFVMSDAGFAGRAADEPDRIVVVLNWLELLRRQTSGQ